MGVAIDTHDLVAHYDRIRSLGMPIAVELRHEPWGDRHSVVVDPNGIGVDVVEHFAQQS